MLCVCQQLNTFMEISVVFYWYRNQNNQFRPRCVRVCVFLCVWVYVCVRACVCVCVGCSGGDLYFCSSTFSKLILQPSKASPQLTGSASAGLLLLSKIPVQLNAAVRYDDAWSNCQSPDQYSLRCVKDGSGCGHCGWVRVDSHAPGRGNEGCFYSRVKGCMPTGVFWSYFFFKVK